MPNWNGYVEISLYCREIETPELNKLLWNYLFIRTLRVSGATVIEVTHSQPRTKKKRKGRKGFLGLNHVRYS